MKKQQSLRRSPHLSSRVGIIRLVKQQTVQPPNRGTSAYTVVDVATWKVTCQKLRQGNAIVFLRPSRWSAERRPFPSSSSFAIGWETTVGGASLYSVRIFLFLQTVLTSRKADGSQGLPRVALAWRGQLGARQTVVMTSTDDGTGALHYHSALDQSKTSAGGHGEWKQLS